MGAPSKLLASFRRPEYDRIFKFINFPHHNVILHHKDNYLTYDVKDKLHLEMFKMWTKTTERGDKCVICMKSTAGRMTICPKCGDQNCEKCKNALILSDALSENPTGMVRCGGCSFELPYGVQTWSEEDKVLQSIRKQRER